MPQRDPCTGRPVPVLLGFKLTPCGAALRIPPVCPLGRPSGIPAKLDVKLGLSPQEKLGTGVRCLCGTVPAWERGGQRETTLHTLLMWLCSVLLFKGFFLLPAGI